MRAGQSTGRHDLTRLEVGRPALLDNFDQPLERVRRSSENVFCFASCDELPVSRQRQLESVQPVHL